METEQNPLAHCLVADVGVGVVVGRQRIAFVVVEAVAISRDARHIDIPLQARPRHRLRSLLHLGRSGSSLPVVDVVVYNFELAAGERLLQ